MGGVVSISMTGPIIGVALASLDADGRAAFIRAMPTSVLIFSISKPTEFLGRSPERAPLFEALCAELDTRVPSRRP